LGGLIGAAGSLSAIGNPRTMVAATAAITAVSALMIFLAIRPRKRAAPPQPPYRTSR
jgi:hypothetical protein